MAQASGIANSNGGSSRPATVAIIGAGLTGLLTAHGLKKNGFDVIVYEREHSIDARPRDWTILLHWALPILAKLLPSELVDKLPEAICNPHLEFDEWAESLVCYHGETGQFLFKSNIPGSRRVSRQRLRKVLAEGLSIQWGKGLDRIDAGDYAMPCSVRLGFVDGDTVEADYVLGTDGAKSKVRELLFNGGEAARVLYSGFMFATCISQFKDAAKVEAIVKLHPVTAMAMSTSAVWGFGVLYIDEPKDKTNWTTFWVKVWRGSQSSLPVEKSGPETLRYLKQTSKGLAEQFQCQIDEAPDESNCYIDEMKYWVPQPYDNRSGRITLAGDAAHPMLVYRGQGFQHAIVDASNYLDALVKIRDGADRALVLSAYDVEIAERGAKAVKQSLEEADLSMDPNMADKMLMAREGHGRSA
ncbi:hypothetical protein B0T17DRAFT_506013 [Bombardia bombarda]|uniref:FAD-binding domain-containing protein n=1 Tax=Bombardia bombarda TaxID=252184 RepID=A0AA40C8I2_9PEZI|nr:hypothetical protein B0T17DRAFT_506013 [Bombardia bombarda]